jgi:hypothetical protein
MVDLEGKVLLQSRQTDPKSFKVWHTRIAEPSARLRAIALKIASRQSTLLSDTARVFVLPQGTLLQARGRLLCPGRSFGVRLVSERKTYA